VIVVDASAILEILLNTPTGSNVAARLSSPGETLRLEAHLITCDARLSRAHGHEAKVELIR
jgi:predicted nucleic acid-binding protein